MTKENIILFMLTVTMALSGFIAKKVWDHDARLAVIEFSLHINTASK